MHCIMHMLFWLVMWVSQKHQRRLRVKMNSQGLTCRQINLQRHRTRLDIDCQFHRNNQQGETGKDHGRVQAVPY